MARLILPYQSVFDLNGHPLPGAKMYFYEPGTSTPKDTYSDEALTTPNTNPVIADSQGQFGDIFLSGNYRVNLTDADDVNQPDYPAEITAVLDTASAVLLTGAQTVAGEKTFTDKVAVKMNTPIYELEENDGPSNNRLYQIIAASEQFALRLANDDRDSFTTFLIVDRTGNVVDTITLGSSTTMNLTSSGTMNITGTNAINLVSTVLNHNGSPLVPALLYTKVLDIGAWNMNTTTDVTVAHGLTYADIRTMYCMVRGDAAATRVPLDFGVGATDTTRQGFVRNAGTTNVSLYRLTGGSFDSALYSKTTESIDNAAAVDKGDGTVGIPISGTNWLQAKDTTTISGTTNYDGTYTIVSATASEIVITATYVAETFAGTETASFSRGWVIIQYA
jgi:hypothetical protein